MPTTIPANRTAGSVRCRATSARRRECPVVYTSTTSLAPSVWEVNAPGAAYSSPSPDDDISYEAKSPSVEADRGYRQPVGTRIWLMTVCRSTKFTFAENVPQGLLSP